MAKTSFIEKLKLSNLRKMLPYITLAICLSITVLLSLLNYHYIMEHAQYRFNTSAQDVAEKIKNRVHASRTILRGGAGLFNASNDVTREEWKTYVEGLRLGDTYPGIQGVGFSRLIKPEELQRHIQNIRAEGFPVYTVRPEGKREEYTSIVYLEPFDERNRRAFGFDMFSEKKVRGAAMERARDTGETSLSGKVKLMQETEKDIQAGFLMYVPVYRKGMTIERVEDRRAAIYGYVYSPLRINDFVKGALGSILNDIDIEIYDGEEVSEPALMFDSDNCGGVFSNAKRSLFSQKIVTDLYSQKWTFIFTSLPPFEKSIGKHEPWNVFTAGVAISLLIFLFMRSQETARKNALLLADEQGRFARELEDANQELQALNREIELRRAEAEAANRAKSEFLANMSHELRTPLNSIIGFSEIMADEVAGPLTEQQKEYLNDVIESSHHLLNLINDILDLSKVEADKMELELSSFPLCDILRASMTMLREKAMRHNVDLSCDIDPDTDIDITADERKIKQIMFNLLSNAIKFTPEGGSVFVKARKLSSSELRVPSSESKEKSPPLAKGDEGGFFEKNSELTTQHSELDRDFIEISVADTGIGISAEDQERLFRPFQQLESSYTKKYAGTGLGLSLCKKLVELHGGRIWAESEAGKGSRFVFIIPVKQTIDNRP